MLKVENPIILKHKLSPKSIEIITKLIKSSTYGIIQGRAGWLLGENPISPRLQDYINRRITPLGYRLYKGPNNNGRQNAVLAYKIVNLHSDKGLGYDHSTVFIPLDIPNGGARFLNYGSDGRMHDLPLNLGNIVVFDQNKEHKIVFPNDEEGEVKFGIALFLDKI